MSAMSLPTNKADKGVASETLMTMVLPVARAGAVFQANIMMGKFPEVASMCQ